MRVAREGVGNENEIAMVVDEKFGEIVLCESEGVDVRFDGAVFQVILNSANTVFKLHGIPISPRLHAENRGDDS